MYVNGAIVHSVSGNAFWSGSKVGDYNFSPQLVREYCHDLAGQHVSNSDHGDLVASTSIVVPTNFDKWTQTWKLSEVATYLGCHAPSASPSSSGDGFSWGSISSLAASSAAFLPQSPDQFRLPTIISNMTGQGTLASQLAIELFSAVWQYAALLLSFKFIKFLRG